jgi:1-acyl-sn-glycerol-3-phosphate acyltransferase
MRAIYSFLFFKVYKWKFHGNLPELKKYIIIVAPHTSNFDFFVGLAVRSILHLKASFLGKAELFRPPYGWIFRKLGGYPVDRKQHTNLVDAVAAIFDAKDEFRVAIAPEGTRSYVKQWKSGFYYMALKAKVPIVMVSFDFRDKTVYIGEPFSPSGNFEQDWKKIADFYRPRRGRFEKTLPF